jgi:serine/threonine protein kinase
MSTATTALATGGDELADRLRKATLGRYDIYAELGRGGMAAVFLALDLALNRKVALKVMLPELVQGLGAHERFRREARMAAGLSHPHIIPVYAVGEDESLAWFAMKYVDGRPLDSVLAEEGAQAPAFVQAMLRQVGSALDYAHRRGVVHRDVKPANILLDEGGWFVLTDFGIAKATDDVGLTSSGMLIGTPAYMSPEHFEGKPIGPAADQYALGCVAFELLTGQRLFSCATVAELMRAHMLDAPPPITNIRQDCPTTLARAIARTLTKDPLHRFATADDLVHSLDPTSADEQRQVTTQISTLARSGAELRPRISQPLSPIPVNRVIESDKLVAPRKSVAAASTKGRIPQAIGFSLAGASVVAAIAWYGADAQRESTPTRPDSSEVRSGRTPSSDASVTTPATIEIPPDTSPASQSGRVRVNSGTFSRRAERLAPSVSAADAEATHNARPRRAVTPAPVEQAVSRDTAGTAGSNDTIRQESAPTPTASWFSIKLLFRDLTLYIDGQLMRVEKQKTIVVPVAPGRHVIEVRRNECPAPFVDDRIFIAGDTVRYNNKGPCPEGG